MRIVPLLTLLGMLLFTQQAHAAFFSFTGNAVERVSAKDGAIVIDVSTLDKLQARHYHYQEDGKAVKFFVVRDGQGTVRAAIDACEVCWREGKGYILKNSAMLCVNCGRAFAMNRIGIVVGGCNPHPFRFTMENDSIVIAAQELMLQGVKYFPGNRS